MVKIVKEGIPEEQVLETGYQVRESEAVSYTHLTLPTTPYV